MLNSVIYTRLIILCGILGIVFAVLTIVYIKKEGGKKSAVCSAVVVFLCAVFSFLVYIGGLNSNISLNHVMNAGIESINKDILNNVTKKNNIRICRVVNDIDIARGDITIVTRNGTSTIDLGTGRKEQERANDIIEKLSLSMNKKYIDELFGAPVYTLTENELINNFYVLKTENVVIRCIFKEDDSMVGYLVTVNKITEESDETVKFSNPMNGGMILEYGQSTIGGIEPEDYKGKIIVNYGNGGEYNYYWQYYQVLYKNCGFIVAILPYGFYEDSTDMLMELADARVNNNRKKLSAFEADGGDADEAISTFKKYVHPNTYGIINMSYAEYINPCIEDDSWEECVENLLKN